MNRIVLLAITFLHFVWLSASPEPRRPDGPEPSLDEFIAAIKELNIQQMGERVKNDLRCLVRDRNRLRSWVMYHDSKKRRVEVARKGLNRVEALLDEIFPYMVADLAKKAERVVEHQDQLRKDKELKESSNWYLNKTAVKIIGACSILSIGLGYLGGVLGGRGPPPKGKERDNMKYLLKTKKTIQMLQRRRKKNKKNSDG